MSEATLREGLHKLQEKWRRRSSEFVVQNGNPAKLELDDCVRDLEGLLAAHRDEPDWVKEWHGFIGGLNGKPELCMYCGQPELSYRHKPSRPEQGEEK
jgi:hypothetical protein